MAMESSIIPIPSRDRHSAGGISRRARRSQHGGRHDRRNLGSYIGAAIGLLALSPDRAAAPPALREIFPHHRPTDWNAPNDWLQRYETGGVFFARLLPVIRHLISYPAGLVEMNFWKFSLATITGSAIWCSVLAYLGAKAYQVQPDLLTNVDGWLIFVKARSHWIVLFIAVMAVLYLLVLRLSAKSEPARIGQVRRPPVCPIVTQVSFDPPNARGALTHY